MENLPHNHDTQSVDLTTIPTIDTFIPVADSFKLLDDPVRLKCFWVLCHHELCVINLAAIMHMSSPAIAHHLRKLKDCHLITSRKVGKEVYYQSCNNRLVQCLHPMIEHMMDIHCPTQK